MDKVYVIKNWDAIYENNRSKEIKNPSWVPLPNKLHGDGYSLIMEHKDGASIYGAWVVLVCIAQRCDIRGTLMRSNGTPHDIQSISRISRMTPKVIKLMLDYATDILKWLEIKDLQSGAIISHKDAVESQESIPIQKDIEQDRKKRKDRTLLDVAINNFKDMRKTIKKPLSGTAEELLLGKLEKLAPGDDDKKIKILEKSIFHSWQGVFSLDEDTKKSKLDQQEQEFIHG